MSIDMITGVSLFDKARKSCPKCCSKNTTMIGIGSTKYHRCWDCEHTWETFTNKKEKNDKD